MPPITPDILTIEQLNNRAEGVARLPMGAVTVPYTLEGEQIECALDIAAGRGRALRIVSPSPHRTDPFCSYFGHCGGCVTQHIEHQHYLEWKTGLVRDALLAAGISTRVEPCVDAHGRGRRRATLHARRGGGKDLVVGFAELRSHTLIAIDHCPILVPELEAAIPALRGIVAGLSSSGKALDLAATATAAGIDLDIRGLGTPTEQQRLRLIRLAEHYGLARLSVHGNLIVERRAPVVDFGDVAVVPPCGGFLQATAEGQDVLFALVKQAVGAARKVADLFAGSGTFALQLAKQANVHAVEGDKEAIAALDRARRHAKGLKPLSVETRDLFRRPLLKHELNGFDAVVFDPPRAGAEAQAKQLSSSNVRRLVAVSCSPTTLARDLRLLIAGGYDVSSVTPVDQFRHSAHVEVVAVLDKRTS